MKTNFPRAKPYRRTSTDIKALVRHRDGYRCTKCGMTAKQHFKKYKRTLDVHRLVPGSRYTIKGCVTLCRKCHGPQPRSRRWTGRDCFSTIPGDVAQDARIVAGLLGMTMNRYIAKIVREAIRRDRTVVAETLAKRAEQLNN